MSRRHRASDRGACARRPPERPPWEAAGFVFVSDALSALAQEKLPARVSGGLVAASHRGDGAFAYLNIHKHTCIYKVSNLSLPLLNLSCSKQRGWGHTYVRPTRTTLPSVLLAQCIHPVGMARPRRRCRRGQRHCDTRPTDRRAHGPENHGTACGMDVPAQASLACQCASESQSKCRGRRDSELTRGGSRGPRAIRAPRL